MLWEINRHLGQKKPILNYVDQCPCPFKESERENGQIGLFPLPT